ncbi:MAG: hypothetical protein ACJAVI_004547 [Candidatus Azotimanducaceae bacterium]|jgi:hypothetical protein
MVLEEAEGKPIALILWRKKDDGEDDLAVFKGILTQQDGTYYLDREEGYDRSLTKEWLGRIDTVPMEVKAVLLDCDYQLSLNLDELTEAGGLEKFGFSWPVVA